MILTWDLNTMPRDVLPGLVRKLQKVTQKRRGIALNDIYIWFDIFLSGIRQIESGCIFDNSVIYQLITPN